MCARFLFFTGFDNEEIKKIFEQLDKKYNKSDIAQLKSGEIFPTDNVPVVVSKHNKKNALICKWGFPGYKNKGTIINARSETIDQKVTFKKLLYRRRCIIPAFGFFEWQKKDKIKNKYLIRPEDHSFFYMAGLYNTYMDKNGKPYDAFVVITTNANYEMSRIHDRMPVILEKDMSDEWLLSDFSNGDANAIKEILRPYEKDLLFEKIDK